MASRVRARCQVLCGAAVVASAVLVMTLAAVTHKSTSKAPAAHVPVVDKIGHVARYWLSGTGATPPVVKTAAVKVLELSTATDASPNSNHKYVDNDRMIQHKSLIPISHNQNATATVIAGKTGDSSVDDANNSVDQRTSETPGSRTEFDCKVSSGLTANVVRANARHAGKGQKGSKRELRLSSCARSISCSSSCPGGRIAGEQKSPGVPIFIKTHKVGGSQFGTALHTAANERKMRFGNKASRINHPPPPPLPLHACDD